MNQKDNILHEGIKLIPMKANIIFIACLFISSIAYSQQTDSSFLSFGAGYKGDIASNFSGGQKTGTTYMGVMDIQMEFNFESAKLWRGGILYANFENTHGGGLSNEFVGDIQVVSNIENGNASYLYELWYLHTFSKGWVKIGKIDMNADFLASDFAGEYINSSFGIMPTASSLPVSIFPKNSTAICGSANLATNLSLKLGVFDGDPLDLEQDKYSTNFKIGGNEGFMFIGEASYQLNESTVRVGIYNHTAEFTEIANQGSTSTGNFGFYTVNDFSLSEKMGVFLKAGLQNDKINEVDKFIGAGVNYSLFENLLAGAAFASVSFSSVLQDNNPDQEQHETAIELFAKYSFLESVLVQPEIQYIINPGAQGADNALVALIRTAIEF